MKIYLSDSLVKDYSINFNELLQKEKYPDFCLPSYIDHEIQMNQILIHIFMKLNRAKFK